MAKRKLAADTEMAKKAASGKKGASGQLLLVFGLVVGAVFLPSSALLLVGMLPTVVAALADWSPRKARAITVGAMNLAGCSPFLFQLWAQGHTFEVSVSIFTDPTAVIVMYGAAGIGYLIDWLVSSVVAAMVFQQALARKKFIKQRQADLVERWGLEVTGDVPLDDQGFPLAPPTPKSLPRP